MIYSRIVDVDVVICRSRGEIMLVIGDGQRVDRLPKQ